MLYPLYYRYTCQIHNTWKCYGTSTLIYGPLIDFPKRYLHCKIDPENFLLSYKRYVFS